MATALLTRKPKGVTARLRASKKRQRHAGDKAVYLAAFERDGYRCRACSEYVGVDAHPHHLRGKRFTATPDIATLCQDCHGFLHVRVGGKLMKIYGDADQRDDRGRLCGLTLETRENNGAPIMGDGYIARGGVQWRVESGL